MKKILAIIILALAAAAMVAWYASITHPLHKSVIIGAALVGGFMAVVWAMRVLLFDDEDEEGDTE